MILGYPVRVRGDNGTVVCVGIFFGQQGQGGVFLTVHREPIGTNLERTVDEWQRMVADRNPNPQRKK